MSFVPQCKDIRAVLRSVISGRHLGVCDIVMFRLSGPITPRGLDYILDRGPTQLAGRRPNAARGDFWE